MRKEHRFQYLGLALSLALVTALPLICQSARSSEKSQTRPDDSKTADASSSVESMGEKKFKQNCSRCHEAPEGFSPRISGTIVRHMRVRASLSHQDEEDILHFLNPQ